MKQAGDTLTNLVIYGILFTHGKRTGSGGALFLEDGNSKVTAISCSFQSNWATQGGAIYLQGSIDVFAPILLDVATTTFSSNGVSPCDVSPAEACGADLGVSQTKCVVTIQSGCPDHWSGTPEQGASLDPSEPWVNPAILNSDRSELRGELKNFDVGTCTPPTT